MPKIKAGDYVRYPLGFNELVVAKVFSNKKGDLYIIENGLRRFLYKSMRGYKWDTSLSKQMGFNKASKQELIDAGINNQIKNMKLYSESKIDRDKAIEQLMKADIVISGTGNLTPCHRREAEAIINTLLSSRNFKEEKPLTFEEYKVKYGYCKDGIVELGITYLKYKYEGYLTYFKKK